ncbi:hypothetical protein K438DRAFT_1821491 [Mycena galopus ATCC 62051]|nr:hypothetical protein K438DRAFT_1821491 [Mycena galopus ATCC 62051]
MTTYLLDLALSSNAKPTHSSFLVVTSAPPPEPSEVYAPNALTLFPQLISLIRTTTPIPIPDPILDKSCALLPYPYLVTPIYPLTSTRLVSLAQARATQLLTPQQQALIDLQLGQYLGTLHSGAQNDWFGLPSATPPADPAFLFADADTPSLVWFTGSPEDVFLAFTPEGAFSAFAILPAVAHALWGDPLLETFFAGPEETSAAFWEGYRNARGEQDGSLVVFPRQRTKRLWYDVFLALVVLRERRGVEDEKTRWASEILTRCAGALRDAPCS